MMSDSVLGVATGAFAAARLPSPPAASAVSALASTRPLLSQSDWSDDGGGESEDADSDDSDEDLDADDISVTSRTSERATTPIHTPTLVTNAARSESRSAAAPPDRPPTATSITTRLSPIPPPTATPTPIRPSSSPRGTTAADSSELNILGESAVLSPKRPSKPSPTAAATSASANSKGLSGLRATRRTQSKEDDSKSKHATPNPSAAQPAYVKHRPSFIASIQSDAIASVKPSILDDDNPPSVQSFMTDVVPLMNVPLPSDSLAPSHGDRPKLSWGRDRPLTPSRAQKDSAPATFVPNTVSLNRIDHAVAAKASVAEIIERRYTHDPTEDQAPDKDKLLGYERAFRETKEAAAATSEQTEGAAPDGGDATEKEWIPYNQQGDSSLYNPQLMVLRDSLQYHPRIAKWISRYWHSFAHQYHVGFMAYREYEAMHLRMTKALFAVWDRRDALALCKLDWRRDTRALPGVAVAMTGAKAATGSLMSYAHFSKSLFELVDLWTTTVDVEEYIDFLAILYARITIIVDKEIAPPAEKHARPQPTEDAVSHADPQHRHNAVAEERRKRAAAAAATNAAQSAQRPSGASVDLLTGSASPGSVQLPSQRTFPAVVEEESSSLDHPEGAEWAGFGFMANYRTNVDQIRERKRARAEALAFEERHGHLPGPLANSSFGQVVHLHEDDSSRYQLDGSFDSGLTKILPVIDHVRMAEEAARRQRDDPDDTLNQRFPVPQFARTRTRMTGSGDGKEFAIASSRVMTDMPGLSEEEVAERRAERKKQKELDDAEAAAKISAVEEEGKAEEAAPAPEQQADHASSDGDGESEAEPDAEDEAPRRRRRRKKGSKRAQVASQHKKPAPTTVDASANRPKRDLTISVTPRTEPRTIKEKDWATQTAERQEEMKKKMIDRAIAIRRQARVEKALIAAQKRLDEIHRLEQARLRELAEKEERELAFFRQLDESIAQADPSYVAPPLPLGAKGRSDAPGSNFEVGTIDASDVKVAKTEDGSQPPGYRTRASTLALRSRPHGNMSSSPDGELVPVDSAYLTSNELERARLDKMRTEDRKRSASLARQAVLSGDEDGDIASDLEDMIDSSSSKLAPLDSIEPLPLDGLAPLNEDGAYDEYTPELQSQLSAEIAKLSLLDAKLRRSFGPSAGGSGAGDIWRPWEDDTRNPALTKKGSLKSLLTAHDRLEVNTLLLDQSKRLKFLRKKTKLASKSGMENRAELRELEELEKKLEGRINRAGDVLQLSFLSLAMKSISDKNDDDRAGRYTGFKVASAYAPMNRGDSAQRAKAEGESKFWSLRKKLAKRRVLKYSAMAILECDEENMVGGGGGTGGGTGDEEVLTLNLSGPTDRDPNNAWLNGKTSVKAYKKTAIQRTLEHARPIRNLGENARKSWAEIRAEELEAEEAERAARMARDAGSLHFSRRQQNRMKGHISPTTEKLLSELAAASHGPRGSGSASPTLEQVDEGAEGELSSDATLSSFDSRSNSDDEYYSSATDASSRRIRPHHRGVDSNIDSVAESSPTPASSSDDSLSDLPSAELVSRRAALRALLSSASEEYSLTGSMSSHTRHLKKGGLIRLKKIRDIIEHRRADAKNNNQPFPFASDEAAVDDDHELTAEELAERRLLHEARDRRRERRRLEKAARREAKEALARRAAEDAARAHRPQVTRTLAEAAQLGLSPASTNSFLTFPATVLVSSTSPATEKRLIESNHRVQSAGGPRQPGDSAGAPTSGGVVDGSIGDASERHRRQTSNNANRASTQEELAERAARQERRLQRRLAYEKQKKLAQQMRATGRQMMNGQLTSQSPTINADLSAPSTSPTDGVDAKLHATFDLMAAPASGDVGSSSPVKSTAAALINKPIPVTELLQALQDEYEQQQAWDMSEAMRLRQAADAEAERQRILTVAREEQEGATQQALHAIKTRAYEEDTHSGRAQRQKQRLMALAPNPLSHIYSRLHSTPGAAPLVRDAEGAPTDTTGEPAPILLDVSSLSRPAALRLQMSRADLLPTVAPLPLGDSRLNPVGLSGADLPSEYDRDAGQHHAVERFVKRFSTFTKLKQERAERSRIRRGRQPHATADRQRSPFKSTFVLDTSPPPAPPSGNAASEVSRLLHADLALLSELSSQRDDVIGIGIDGEDEKEDAAAITTSSNLNRRGRNRDTRKPLFNPSGSHSALNDVHRSVAAGSVSHARPIFPAHSSSTGLGVGVALNGSSPSRDLSPATHTAATLAIGPLLARATVSVTELRAAQESVQRALTTSTPHSFGGVSGTLMPAVPGLVESKESSLPDPSVVSEVRRVGDSGLIVPVPVIGRKNSSTATIGVEQNNNNPSNTPHATSNMRYLGGGFTGEIPVPPSTTGMTPAARSSTPPQCGAGVNHAAHNGMSHGAPSHAQLAAPGASPPALNDFGLHLIPVPGSPTTSHRFPRGPVGDGHHQPLYRSKSTTGSMSARETRQSALATANSEMHMGSLSARSIGPARPTLSFPLSRALARSSLASDERSALLDVHERSLIAARRLARATRQPVPESRLTQDELEWAKEVGLKAALQGAAHQHASGTAGVGFSARAPRATRMQLHASMDSAIPRMQMHATMRAHKKTAFAPPLHLFGHTNRASEATQPTGDGFGLVAFGV